MKKIHFIFPLLLLLFSCTKEVTIDIPGYEEQIVIDGRIETGQPPIILISKSKEVYSSTDLNSFLSGFVSGAVVTISDGTTTIQLDEICSDNLPPGTEALAAAILGIPVSELANYNICAYTTLNASFIGTVGKTYQLSVSFNGKTYTASTSILTPTPLNNVFWKFDGNSTTHGYSWAELTDPINQKDAYMWEVKRINTDENGDFIDQNYTKTYSPVFDDVFFDGLTFEFWYENPNAYGNATPESIQGKYALNDTVVIKFSKMDAPVFEFFEKKYAQLQTAGNPFATPTNIPTNFTGGALGIWAGFSPSYDTLICIP